MPALIKMNKSPAGQLIARLGILNENQVKNINDNKFLMYPCLAALLGISSALFSHCETKRAGE